MLKQAGCCLALVFALCGPSWADDAQQAVMPPAAAPIAKPSDAQLAAARDLLDAAGAKSVLNALFASLVPMEVAGIRQKNPHVSDEAISAFTTAMQDELSANTDQLMNIYAELYAEHFSTEELQQISAFYRSDVGKKVIATMPQLLKELQPLALRWGAELGAHVRERVNAQLQKRGDSL